VYLKLPGKYINGGCGADLDLPASPTQIIPPRTECGLSLNSIPLYCNKCKGTVVNIYG